MTSANDSGSLLLLKASGLAKGYQMSTESLAVLSGFDLTVRRGDMVVVMGPSGSGKTTLLNCLSRIDEPDEGSGGPYQPDIG